MQYIRLTDDIDRLNLERNRLKALTKRGVKTVKDFIQSPQKLKGLPKRIINDIENIINDLYSGKGGYIIGDSEKSDPILSCVLDVMSLNQAINLHYDLLFVLEKQESMTIEEIMKKFPEQNIDVVKKMLAAMAEYDELYIENSTYIAAPSIVDYIESMQDKRKRDIALSVLQDKRAVDIANHFGMTRQRVYQICTNIFRFAHKEIRYFREDKYLNFFSKYLIFAKDFMSIFDEPISTYKYLQELLLEIPNRENFTSALQDETLPLTMRKQLEEVIYYKNYVKVDGRYIANNRKVLAMYYTKKYCTDITKYEDFKRGYRTFLDELGLFNRAVIKDHDLGECLFVLWSFRKQFRYYKIQSRDYEKLLDEINIMQYDGSKISTLNLFKKHRKLMAEYDIRNGYELHNLLKKIIYSDRITFKRMPIIIVGEERN